MIGEMPRKDAEHNMRGGGGGYRMRARGWREKLSRNDGEKRVEGKKINGNDGGKK